MRTKVRSLLLIGVLALAACSGGTQTDARSNCSSSGRSGTCTLTLVSIEGYSYRHEFQNSEFWPGAPGVQVKMQVTVEKGRVRVWLEDGQHNQVSALVEPGKTTELAGTAWLDTIGGDKRSFYVYFEPLITDDVKRAENVQALIQYDMP